MNTFLFMKISLIIAVIIFFVVGINFIITFDIFEMFLGLVLGFSGVKIAIQVWFIHQVHNLFKTGVITKKKALDMICTKN